MNEDNPNIFWLGFLFGVIATGILLIGLVSFYGCTQTTPTPIPLTYPSAVTVIEEVRQEIEKERADIEAATTNEWKVYPAFPDTQLEMRP